MSRLVKQEQCPKCARLGGDRANDNFALYSDGHGYCYKCNYYIPGNKLFSFVNKHIPTIEIKHEVFLPYDSDISYPVRALDWMAQYELGRSDMLNNNCLWSESEQRLIFPIYGGEGLLAWVGRYFGTEGKPKWYVTGNVKDVFHILGKGDKIVLVEDIVSSIKLSRFCMVMPVFGSSVGVTRFKRLFKQLKRGTECIIWLDPDMRSQSVKESKLGALCGLKTRTMFSERDPKEIPYVDLERILK